MSWGCRAPEAVLQARLCSKRLSLAGGFTLIELLVSVVILGAAVAVIAQASNIVTASTRRGNALTEVQNLVSRDLNWIRWYAKAWNCTTGSYATCTTQSASAILRYNDTQLCATLVATFLQDAANGARANDNPPRPFPIPNTAGTAQVLQAVNGTNLSRTIAIPASTSGTALPQSVQITYTYPGQPPYNRASSVLIQAGGWCRMPA